VETTKEIKARYGNPVDLGFATVVITKAVPSAKTTKSGISLFPVQVRFSTVDGIASSYRGKVQLNLTDKNSSLIDLTLNDPVKEKARDILDQLILEYNRQAIEDKNLVATNTARFIEDRLAIITQELDSVETGKEEFKESNQLTDIEAESQMFIENISDFNKKRQEVATQLELSNAMLEYINSDSQSDLLPANRGMSEAGVNAAIAEYNSLVLERNRVLSGSTERNPVVISLTDQLEQIKGNVIVSLQRMRSNLLISQRELSRQAGEMGSKIAAVPGKEKQFRGILRQQNIKEALYLFLLQKREETSLSLAVTAPKAKIVDSAYTLNNPVAPKGKIILLAALILGIMIPFLRSEERRVGKESRSRWSWAVSSRRRHTRFSRDWSSDVCSSDLIKEALYLFLLQKREETSLSLAVTAPKAKIVDSAYTLNNPVAPKGKIILLAALILGIMIPFLSIYLKNLFNNKVHSQKDMQKATKSIPIVGEIPKVGRNEDELIVKNDRSVLSEAFRILHTNLQYLLVNSGSGDEQGEILFVSSTVKG